MSAWQRQQTQKLSFFGLDRQFHADRAQYLRRIEEVLASGQVLQSSHVEDFETRVAGMTHRRFAVAVNSCTDALYFALRAAGIQPGDEVLVPTWSFIASASCICRAGAKPVFVDVDDSYNMDLRRAAAAVTRRATALIFVHLYGQMSDPEQVEAFAKVHNLVLIEDAAQAIGASFRARPAGSMGLASCLSFDPTKPVSAPGCGGVVVTDDADLAASIRRQRYHGKTPDGLFAEIGFNSQMSALTAFLLQAKVDRQPEWQSRRRSLAQTYIHDLSDVGCHFVLPTEQSGATHIYHKFVLRTPHRDALKASLDAAGIPTMIHYQRPLHQQPCFSKEGNWNDEDYPKACAFAREVLSLPIHPFLTRAEIAYIVDNIRRFFRRARTVVSDARQL